MENRSQEIAQTIRGQIEAGVRWSIGYRPGTELHGMFHFSDGAQDEGLMFSAKPRHRVRRIAITLNFMDTYDIRVIDDKGVRVLVQNVFVDQLNRALLDLESNPKA